MDVTASYLEASVLTLVLPVALLIAITIWWVIVFRRRSSDDA
jgi:cytochrome c-type biogenesis protein CcmH/NrfF